jgi:hypothetical protein
MVVCGLVVVAALALAVRWRNYAFTPDLVVVDSPVARLRGLVRLLAVGALTGLIVGTLFVGPAGRLAMRLLAATSPDAQGRRTEAEEVVGRITVGGTIGFVVFVGVFGGLAVGLVYVFVARAFPRGLLGGALYGATLLVLFSWWQEPLRAANRDFDIVGPGWLSVTTFIVMALGTGAVTAPTAGRISAAVSEPKLWWVVWLAPLGLLAMGALVNAPPALVIVVVGGLTYLLLPDAGGLLRRRGRLVLQVAVGAAVLVTLPGFLSAVVDIA